MPSILELAAMDSEQLNLYLFANQAMLDGTEPNCQQAAMQMAPLVGAVMMLSIVAPASLESLAMEVMRDG